MQQLACHRGCALTATVNTSNMMYIRSPACIRIRIRSNSSRPSSRSPLAPRATQDTTRNGPEKRVAELRLREAEYKQQLDELKRRAMEAHAALCNAAAAAAGSSGRLIDDGAGAGVSDLRARIEQAIDAVQSGLVERDTEVRLLLLAALSGEHVLYIGPPGTAKSELGRRLCRLCSDGAAYFERLLTRFSVPEELFGPLSMRALEEDKYVRQTQGYLPEATVAFVDEIFKVEGCDALPGCHLR